MRVAFSLFLALLFGVSPAVAQTWPTPGEGFTWERVGDRAIDPFDLAFDTEGRLWVAASDGPYRLDSKGIWRFLNDKPTADAVLPLGRGDTTLVSDVRMRRTTDDGETWAEVVRRLAVVRNGFVEVPAGLAPGDLPADLRSGHILALERSGLQRSDDRGATWRPVPATSSHGSLFAVLVLPPNHPTHPGRLLVGGFSGGLFVGTTAADGSLALIRTPESDPESTAYRATEHLAAFPASDPLVPGRLLMTGFLAGQAHNRVFASDDGGDSWQEKAALPEPRDGIPGDAWLAVVGPGAALAVGGRGIVYRTDDGGETWAVVGRTPITDDSATSQEVLVGPDGRLYLGVKMAGPADEWVYRTASLYVSVAAEPMPPEDAAFGLGEPVPNPARGEVAVRYALSEAGVVRITVYDALGREVAVMARGEHEPGTHTARLDAGSLAPGVYLVRLAASEVMKTRRLTVVR